MNLNKITNENLSLTTLRLKMSLMTKADWPYFKLIQMDPELMQHIGPILSEIELKSKFEQRIRPWQENEAQWLTLIVKNKITNNFVGSIAFKLDSIAFERAEIGYLMLNKYQGLGYSIEAGAELINYLFNTVQLSKLIAHCSTINTASWKVMEKLGFKREAELKMQTKLKEDWFDDYGYGLINPALVI